MSAEQKSWRPTNKWWAAQCTATATLAVAWVSAGEWTKPLTIALIGAISQATAAYLVSNAEPTPAGSAVGGAARGAPTGALVPPPGVQGTAA